MKALALILAVSVTSACSAGDDGQRDAQASVEPTVEAAEEESVAGRYEVKRSDGYSYISVINDDGTYSEVVDGNEIVTGTWEPKGEQTCYDPDGEAKVTCYSFAAPTEPTPEGSFTATSDEGVVHLVRPLDG